MLLSPDGRVVCRAHAVYPQVSPSLLLPLLSIAIAIARSADAYLVFRAVVFIGITFLYARLYVFLKRPDKIRSPYSNSPTGMSYDSSAPKRKIQGFLRKFSGGGGGGGADEAVPAEGQAQPTASASASAPEDTQKQEQEQEYGRTNRPTMRDSSTPNPAFQQPNNNTTAATPSSAPVSPATEIPPWERMELPVFHVDGQRYGGPSASGAQGAGQGQSQGQGMFGGWKGLGGAGGGGKKRPSTANSSGSGSNSPAAFGQAHTQGRMGSISTASRILQQQQQQDIDTRSQTRSRQASGDTTLYNSSHGTATVTGRKLSSGATSTTIGAAPGLLPGMSRRASALPPDTSPVLEQDNETFFGVERTDRQRSGPERSEPERASAQSDPERAEDENENDEDEDAEMDLLRMLRQDSEPDVAGGGRRYGSGGDGSGGDYELVPESMASYLNRKTALLMLWFPLGVGVSSLSTPLKRQHLTPRSPWTQADPPCSTCSSFRSRSSGSFTTLWADRPTSSAPCRDGLCLRRVCWMR